MESLEITHKITWVALNIMFLLLNIFNMIRMEDANYEHVNIEIKYQRPDF